MTKDDALKLALEALIFNQANWQGKDQAIAAIKEALAQHDSVQAKPEPEQEPVAWDNCRSENQCRSWCGNSTCVSHWYYTTPPQRTWVGLTDDEQQEAYEQWQNDGWGVFYNAIEAKLREKNK